MSRLMRDGTTEPVSRDQILRRERDREKLFFPVQLTTSRISNLTRLTLTLVICDDHTYILLVVGRNHWTTQSRDSVVQWFSRRLTKYKSWVQSSGKKLVVGNVEILQCVAIRRRYFRHAHFIPIVKRGAY